VVIGRAPTATSGGQVGSIKGLVDVYGNGSVALTVDDSGDTNGHTITLSGSSVSGLAPGTISYDTNVTSVTINGGSGNNTLVGPNVPTYWVISGTNAGSINNLSFTNVENLVGGTETDTFWFEPGASVVSIDGGGAPAGQGDWLDYADYSGAVTVNLATGTATGVIGTISNIQNVFGGNFGNTLVGNAQGNILIGGDGDDTIIGGSGRSILIGGKGSDTIVGGSGDDIIIGGYTLYDSAWHEAALMEDLARWQTTDSYATRVSILRATWHPLYFGTTVFDDGAADQVTGGAGMDWFFVGSQDTVTDYQGGEFVN
jgi:Ca2+-binding RTX toxin-like protein